MERLMYRYRYMGAVVGLLALFVLWPNLVHEPLHWVALQLQGSAGHIHFDWRLPATPFIERTAPLAGLGGGLLYLLLPAMVQAGIVAWLWRTRAHATLALHGVLGVYLSYDLLRNLLGFMSPTSDFRMLQVLPFGGIAAGLFMVLVSVTAMQLLWHVVRLERRIEQSI